MSKTKEQQAQEYGVTRLQERVSERVVSPREYINRALFYFDDMEQAYLDGYTAAEQSMWRSVEEELPEDNILVVVWIFGSTVLTDFCEDGKWHYSNVRFWMPIPSLPETNTKRYDGRRINCLYNRAIQCDCGEKANRAANRQSVSLNGENYDHAIPNR